MATATLRPNVRRLSVAAAVLVAVTVAAPSPASSQMLAVTSTADGGAGSLREAVDQANATGSASVIVLSAGSQYVLSECGSDGLSSTGGPLTIVGNGATIRQSCAGERVLRNDSDGLLRVEGVTLTGGDASIDGGAILSTDGPVAIIDSTIEGNRAAGDGGGVFVDGTSLRIERSSIRGNQSFDYGGGVGVDGELHMTGSTVEDNTVTADNAYGGGVYVRPTGAIPALIATSTIRGNHVDGATGLGGGIYLDGDSLVLDASTVADNIAGGDGGGIYSYYDTTIIRSTVSGNSTGGRGGGIFSFDPMLELSNSTVTANTAALSGGGVFADGFDLSVVFVTFSANSAASGSDLDLGGGDLRAFATVLADPTGSASCAQAVTVSEGHNYEQGGDSCGLRAATDLTAAGPAQLGLLADNGGATLTQLPGATSPLLDAIPADHAACSVADQRGVTRPQGGSCDIGAVERSEDPTGNPPPGSTLAFVG